MLCLPRLISSPAASFHTALMRRLRFRRRRRVWIGAAAVVFLFVDVRAERRKIIFLLRRCRLAFRQLLLRSGFAFVAALFFFR